MYSISKTINSVDNGDRVPNKEGKLATMVTLGDYVINRQTGHIGTVIGYGHEMVNNVYTPTLKVRVFAPKDSKTGFIKEDLSFNWRKSH